MTQFTGRVPPLELLDAPYERCDAPPDRPDASSVSPEIIDRMTDYCSLCWKNFRFPVDRWDDCTQDVFCRLARFDPLSWGDVFVEETELRKEFIRAIDATKKRALRQRTYRELPPENDLLDRRALAADRQQEKIEIVHHYLQWLSSYQRKIMLLRLDGHDVPSIAKLLCTKTERISDQTYKAIQKLRERMREVLQP